MHRSAYEGVLGTSLEITVGSGKSTAGPQAESRILAEIDRLEKVFSVFQMDSELNQWQKSYGEAIPVSNDLAIVLEAAERWRKVSNGTFLPIVEALTRAWKNAELTQADNVPDKDVRIDPLAPMWEIDLENLVATRLTRHPASLNAIAKGYIVDRAVEVAIQIDSVKKVMVNIGGDLRHLGEGEAIVAITDPEYDAENARPLCHVRISNQAVATSGGYRRGFRVDGMWHSHVFDPISEKPTIEVRSSSLIASSAMEADILATILGVLPPKSGLDFASRNGAGALVVDMKGDSHQNERWSKARCSDGANGKNK